MSSKWYPKRDAKRRKNVTWDVFEGPRASKITPGCLTTPIFDDLGCLKPPVFMKKHDSMMEMFSQVSFSSLTEPKSFQVNFPVLHLLCAYNPPSAAVWAKPTWIYREICKGK